MYGDDAGGYGAGRRWSGYLQGQVRPLPRARRTGWNPAGKALKAVSFKDPAVVKAKDADLIAAVTNGKNKMPAFNGKLSPADIKAAVGYIRTLAK